MPAADKQATANIVLVTYTGCGHILRHRSQAIVSPEVTCTGDCPRCKAQPILFYLFGETYWVRFPEEMQFHGMGTLDIPTPYTVNTHVDDVIAILRRAYPLRHIYQAEQITSVKYESLKHHQYVVGSADGIERAMMLLEGVTTLTPFVIRDDDAGEIERAIGGGHIEADAVTWTHLACDLLHCANMETVQHVECPGIWFDAEQLRTIACACPCHKRG